MELSDSEKNDATAQQNHSAARTREQTLNRKIRYACADSINATYWKNVEEPLGRFLARLSEGKAGPKDGWSYLQGSFAKDGRRQGDLESFEGFVFDVDDGQPQEEVKARIVEAEIEAVLHPTASSEKTESSFSADKIHEHYRLSDEQEASPEQVLAFVRGLKDWRPEVSESFKFVAYCEQEYRVSHIPYPRYRVIVPRAEAVRFVDLGKTKKGAKDKHKKGYRAVARWIGITNHDTSCEDQTRAYYGFRGPHLAGVKAWRNEGRFLTQGDVDALIMAAAIKENVNANDIGATAAPKPKDHKKSTKQKREGGEKNWTPATKNLVNFAARYGAFFEVVDWLKHLKRYEDRGPATDGGVSFECPSAGRHSDGGGGTRFFARNASDNGVYGFHIYCGGDTCKKFFARDNDASKQDRLKWLDYICKENGVTDAMTLQEWCKGQPDESALPYGFYLRKGLIWKTIESGDDEENDGGFPVCAAFRIVGRVRDERSGKWSKLFAFNDPDGVTKDVLIADAELHGDGAELFKRLADAGLKIEVGLGPKRAMCSLLSSMDTDVKIRSASKTGFQDNGVFILPVGPAVVPDDADDATKAETFIWANRPPDFTATKGGSYPGWQQAARLALTARSPHIGLGLLLGTIGPMTHCLGLESHGIYWAGPSSLGKSSAQIAQVGVWADPRTGKGLRRCARSTGNALETAFEMFNGTTGALDDLQNGGHQLAQDASYMASNGAGRARLTKDATSKETRHWTGLSYSMSAELVPAQLLREGRREEVAGQYARSPVVSVADAPKMKVRDYDELLALLNTNYAHAGEKIVREFHKQGWHRHPEELKARLNTALNELSAGLHSAQRRSATVFAMALVMGGVMKEAGIIDAECDVQGCVDWGWQRFKASKEFQQLAAGANAMEGLLNWARLSGDVYSIGILPPAGRTVLAFKGACGTLFLPRDSLKAITGLGTTPDAAIAELKTAGRLVKDGDGWTWGRVPGGVEVRHFRITDVFTAGEAEEDSELDPFFAAARELGLSAFKENFYTQH